MPSSSMLRRMVLVRNDGSEELSASIIRVTSICELGTTLDVTSNRRTPHLVFLRSVRRLLVTSNVVSSLPILVTPMMETPSPCETSVFTRVTRPNIQEDGILHSHRRDTLKSYMDSCGSGQGQLESFCERSNELSGSLKCWETI
jgi:hypothetical protein